MHSYHATNRSSSNFPSAILHRTSSCSNSKRQEFRYFDWKQKVDRVHWPPQASLLHRRHFKFNSTNRRTFQLIRWWYNFHEQTYDNNSFRTSCAVHQFFSSIAIHFPRGWCGECPLTFKSSRAARRVLRDRRREDSRVFMCAVTCRPEKILSAYITRFATSYYSLVFSSFSLV